MDGLFDRLTVHHETEQMHTFKAFALSCELVKQSSAVYIEVDHSFNKRVDELAR